MTTDVEIPAKYDDGDFPLGTLAYYGPDETTTTKIVATVITHEDTAPIIQRWVGSSVRTSDRVREQMDAFFADHGILAAHGFPFNIGCAHEEGEDFPPGEDCPFCPSWRGKQGEGRWERLFERLAHYQS